MNVKSVLKVFQENRLLTIVLLVILVGFVAFTVARCSAVNAPVVEQPDSEVAEQPSETDNDKLIYEGGDLSEEQKAVRTSYSADTLDVIALLKANVWTASGDTTSLSFTDEDYSEASSGTKRRTVPYIVTAISGSLESNIEKTQAGSTVGRATLAIETPSGTHLVELTRTTDVKGISSWMITSDAFTQAKSYVRAGAATNFTIVVPESDQPTLEDLFSDKLSVLEAQMRDYCGLYYPSASKATWTRNAVIDMAAATVSTSFKLDNQSNTQITVVFNTATQTFDVGTVR